MQHNKTTEDLVVIGAGPGGYPAAFHAADIGMSVTLIDTEPNPGGVCLYRGCIPTKTLLHVSEVIREAMNAKKTGVTFQPPDIDIDMIRKWKDGIVEKLTGGLGRLTKQRNIRMINGRAKFIDSNSVEIIKNDGTVENVVFKNAIIATGSHPAPFPDLFFETPRIMDSSEALELKDIPEKLLIIGGGYIGLEIGTIYSTLGSEVTIVEMMPDILPGADSDLIRIYSQSARKIFSAILTNTTVEKIDNTNEEVSVKMKLNDGKIHEAKFDKVLITIGRKPNSDNLGLENTAVVTDKNGFIKVNDKLQTDDPKIYAIGDVVGGAMLAHKATHEGRTAVEVISGKDVEFKPKAIPAVLFTDPEISWCGLTETEAKLKNINIGVGRFPWAASGRSVSLGRSDGMTKVIVDPETEKILGLGIVGPNAGELIAEGALAIEAGLRVSDLKKTIHPHPTLSETLMEAAEVFSGECVHIYKPQKK